MISHFFKYFKALTAFKLHSIEYSGIVSLLYLLFKMVQLLLHSHDRLYVCDFRALCILKMLSFRLLFQHWRKELSRGKRQEVERVRSSESQFWPQVQHKVVYKPLVQLPRMWALHMNLIIKAIRQPQPVWKDKTFHTSLTKYNWTILYICM